MGEVRRFKLTAVAAIALGAVALSACAGPAAQQTSAKETGGEIPSANSESLVRAATQEGRIVWYTSNTRQGADAAAKLFEQTYPGIDVEVFQAGGSQVTAKVESEAMAGGIKADVVDYSDGAVALNQADRGLFERYLPEGADQISDNLRDPDGYWFSPYYLTATIVYNPRVVSEADAPTSWQDLTNPKWKNKVGMASPDYAGTAVATIATWEQKFGEDYIQALGDNGLTVFEGFGNVHDAVLSGQMSLGVNLSFRAIMAEKQGKSMKSVAPKEGQILLPSAAAIVKGAKHLNAAKLFSNFLLSDELQTLMTESLAYFPAKTPIAAKVKGMPDMNQVQILTGDRKAMADTKNVARIKQLFKGATS